MAKISRKRKDPQLSQEEQVGSIFDALNAHGQLQGGDDVSPGGSKPNDQNGAGPTTADLMKQLADMQARQDALERANLALTQTVPTQVSQPRATGKEPVDLKGLPDPAFDPEGFSKGLQERVTEQMNRYVDGKLEEQNTARRTAQTETDKYNILWEDFAIAHPELADDMDQVEIAATLLAKDAQRRNIDVQRYMFGNSPRFIEDVAKKHAALFGNKQEAAGGQDEEPASRTGGIFGGLEGGNRPAAQRPAPGDMIKDLHDIQRKTGYY